MNTYASCSLFINFSRYKEDDGDTDHTDSPPAELNSTENSNEPENNSNFITRLCLCTENSQIYVSPLEKGKAVYNCILYIIITIYFTEVFHCTAVDSISEKTVGCNNIADITKYCLLRPSYRVPYIILCDVHYNRMLRHNCCPTCGLFCTQVNNAK